MRIKSEIASLLLTVTFGFGRQAFAQTSAGANSGRPAGLFAANAGPAAVQSVAFGPAFSRSLAVLNAPMASPRLLSGGRGYFAQRLSAAAIQVRARIPAGFSVMHAAGSVNLGFGPENSSLRRVGAALQDMWTGMSRDVAAAGDLRAASAESSYGIGRRAFFALDATDSVRADAWPSATRIDPPADLPNPAGFYPHAYAVAKQEAAARGLNAYFRRATASQGTPGGASWKFTFYLMDSPDAKTAQVLYVDFYRAGFGDYGQRIRVADDPHNRTSFVEDYVLRASPVYLDVPVRGERVSPVALDPDAFHRLSIVGPELARLRVSRGLPAFGAGGVSISLAPRGLSGTPQHLWYRLYDAEGGIGAVSAWTGEVRELRRPAAPRKSVWTRGAEWARRHWEALVVFALLISLLVLGVIIAYWTALHILAPLSRLMHEHFLHVPPGV